METPLRKLRHQRGLSLEELAAAVGSDTGNLSRIETGDQVAGKDFAARLVKFYDSEITELHVIYPERYKEWEPNSHSTFPAECLVSDTTMSTLN